MNTCLKNNQYVGGYFLVITYRAAKRSEKKQLTQLLTTSFLSYDYYKMHVQNEVKRIRFVETIQELCIKIAFKQDYPVFVGVMKDQLVSVAVLIPPKAKKVSLIDYLFAGGVKLARYGGVKNALGFLDMLEESNAACHREYPDAWFLEVLAVSPEVQGKGIGGKMITEWIEPFIQTQGGGVLTLITNSERNRIFYQKNGFVEFHEGRLVTKERQLGNWSYQKVISST